MLWRTSRRDLSFDHLPRIMGIVNVTPDSFTDGGRYEASDVAVDHALQLIADGADVIDIGGESTRPGAVAVDAEEERRRVESVIQSLSQQTDVPISIDTSKASVAQAAFDVGAEIINDVTGLEGDPRMATVAKTTGMGICAMHMRGNPRTMQDHPVYDDVVAEIEQYLRRRLRTLDDQGVDRESICLDPGIGFGKTHQHNFKLIRATKRFANLGRPLLIGHSRKGFISKAIRSRFEQGSSGRPIASGSPDQPDRTAESIDAGTLGVSLAVASAGAHLLRVHDVRGTVCGLTLFAACGGLNAPPEASTT